MLKVISGSFLIFKGTKRNGICVTEDEAVIDHIAEASITEIDATSIG